MQMANHSGRQLDAPNTNRRAFPRWPYPFDLLYGPALERRSAEPLEIGEGGLSFLTTSRLEIDSEINVEFRLGPEQEWVLVRCRVTHSDGKKIGAEFLNLRMADRLRIVDFMTARTA
jgi:hypothetical protein